MPEEFPLPETEASSECELDELMDLIAGNAPLDELREFRRAGVRLGHA